MIKSIYDRSGLTSETLSRRRFAAGLVSSSVALELGSNGSASAQDSNTTSASHVPAVVSSHRLATEAGVEILEAGGTAADAAIAVAAALTVVEPFFSSALGGGLWGLYYEAASGQVTSLDGVGPVGSLAKLEDYRERIDQPGMHQANVPGAWDGWMRWLDRYGSLRLGALLAPAIRLARDGFPASAELAYYAGVDEAVIRSFPDSARTYLANDALPVEGQIVQLPDLVDTFRALRDAYNDGGRRRRDKVQAARDYYYRGPIADAIVAFSDENGGYFTQEDFASFAAEILEPIAIDYRDVRVYQNPPNSQGIAMLLALNTLNGFDFSALDPASADTIHLQVEAIKLAFADRYAAVADPAVVDVPVEGLLSEEHAATQRARIDPGAAMAWPIESDLAARRASHTTTFHVVDRFGNAAAVTTSLGLQFLVVGSTGIHINERNQFMSIEEGDVNQFGPGRKVRHTSCPYMALRDGRPVILGGNTGADTQPQAQLQQLMHIVDFGLGPQEAVDQPRFVSTAFPATYYPYQAANTLDMEQGFPEEVVAELQARGHNVAVGQGIFGSANVLVVAEDGSEIAVGAESRTSDAAGAIISE
jgi:gamma-glutamyltranspeptidase/glutathione hydrolase